MAMGVKPIDRQLFTDGINKFVNGELTIEEAAKYIGRSLPTTIKYFNKVLLNEELPQGFFKDE